MLLVFLSLRKMQGFRSQELGIDTHFSNVSQHHRHPPPQIQDDLEVLTWLHLRISLLPLLRVRTGTYLFAITVQPAVLVELLLLMLVLFLLQCYYNIVCSVITTVNHHLPSNPSLGYSPCSMPQSSVTLRRDFHSLSLLSWGRACNPLPSACRES